MSYDLVEIAGRVQRLERDNRRLRLAAGCLVALVVAVPLVGAVLPVQVPEVIEARSFRVLDEQGKVRVALRAADGWTDGLAFYDEQRKGKLSAFLGSDLLAFYDEQGLSAHLSADILGFLGEQGTDVGLSAAGGLFFIDEQGTVRVDLDADGLGFFDEQGAVRLKLGRVTVVVKRTEAETTYPAALVLFDEAGDVIEVLPR